MNKLIPLSKFSKSASKFLSTSETNVIIDESGVPRGFLFGTNAFIDFLEKMDEEFEEVVVSPKKAHNSAAGKLIDLIEERLPLNPKFLKDLKISTSKKGQGNFIPFEDVIKSLNV